jgi:hypothetical protein
MGNRNKNKKLAVLAVMVIFLSACGSGVSSINENLGTGLEGGVEFSNEYSSPAELGKGDLMYIDFGDASEVNLSFSGVDAEAEFILVVGSANEGGLGTTMQISSDLSAIVEKDASVEIEEENLDYSADEILSVWLRSAEFELAATEPIPEEAGSIGMKAMGMKAAGVGDERSFRVLSSLINISSYTEVEGEARCAGDNIVLYVDTQVSPNLLNDEDINTLCDIYDRIAGEEQEVLGEISDVNGDGRLAILMSPQVNKLGALGGGIITGYFWAGDLYDVSPSNPVSNHMEIIYAMVPDPNGTYGTAVSKDFAMSNLLPPLLPHELQHAISYNQHVFVNGGPPEQNWLNEGMSHLMEDIMGYGIENPSRYALFLANTASVGLVVSGQPNLAERGAAYLFLRYLYEQASSGSNFLAALENTSRTGTDNIEAAFNGGNGFNMFHHFMARWTAALAMTDNGITQDPRYVYRSRVRDADTGNWKGVCLRCSADDNRGTLLNGVSMTAYDGSHSASIAAGAAKFFDMASVPGMVTISGRAGGGNFGVLIRQK